MSYYYGTIDVAFHGKAVDLRRMASFIWEKEELEPLKTCLTIDPSISNNMVLTLSTSFFAEALSVELPCIDTMADKCPAVEIAVVAQISDSITDSQALCSAFYPAGREVYEVYEEEEEEDEEEEEYYDYDPMEYLSYQPGQMTITTTLTGHNGEEYEIDLCDEKIRPEGWNFWAEDPDVIDFLAEEDLEKELEVRRSVLLKCDPETGKVTRVKEYQPDQPRPFGIHAEEQEGKIFYYDEEGHDYFFLSEIPAEQFSFGQTAAELFGDIDCPDWMLEWLK